MAACGTGRVAHCEQGSAVAPESRQRRPARRSRRSQSRSRSHHTLARLSSIRRTGCRTPHRFAGRFRLERRPEQRTSRCGLRRPDRVDEVLPCSRPGERAVRAPSCPGDRHHELRYPHGTRAGGRGRAGGRLRLAHGPLPTRAVHVALRTARGARWGAAGDDDDRWPDVGCRPTVGAVAVASPWMRQPRADRRWPRLRIAEPNIIVPIPAVHDDW